MSNKKPSSIFVTADGVTKLFTNEEVKQQLDAYIKAAQSDEKLCPELEACVSRGGIVSMIRHPLCHQALSFPAMHNQCLNQKREVLADFAKENNLRGMAVMVEKPYRIRWLHHAVAGLDYYGIPKIKVDTKSAAFFEAFTYAWSSSENLWQDTDACLALLELHPTGDKLWRLAMEKDELEVWDNLPEMIEVYRGCEKRNRRGFSWTIDKRRAEWFSTRFFSTSPQVLHGVVKKSDCYFYLGGRGEAEIVVCPSKVKILAVHKPEPHRRNNKAAVAHAELIKTVHGGCGV